MNHSALIFCHSTSPRLQYVIDFLTQYYGLSFRIVYDEEKYVAATDACKINYGYHRLVEGEIFIHSHVLLFETSIRPVKVECFTKNNYKAFFKAEGEFGFDLFAGIFYLLSRYEEYLPHENDRYGRYAHENSIAYKEGFLHLPLINIWLEDFRKLLAEKNKEFSSVYSLFRFQPTYDIDMAWIYRNKGLKRNTGGSLFLLAQGKFRATAQRIRVARGIIKDPYDAYEWMDQLHRQYRLKPVYFFLLARETSKYDKNIDPDNPEQKQLIRSIADKYEVGIHPSWASNDLPSLLTKEKSTLERITDKKITASRQHFIRFTLPATYQRLIALGITDDYSMGYGSINGFRSSVATGHYWYDLKNEEKTKLMIHPFCFMDANAYYEQKLSSEGALDELMHYYNNVRSVNGTLGTIWHNSFLGTFPDFEGWREVYEKFVADITDAV